eukprot:CAMPEP_0176317044 /NCGR_PEP_ID=MMETSP0121_2-20121125/69042_1 /TAXON_ID=160619 /ORGANISM="Kryptoperidinium foliaceum, Strain CCMP 1326" /LENGTH=246 /DNA_ID=CAMNT_0017659267 /DNA_START=27 /DNA_END=767 /DNA_ORIENTATION=+
MAVATMQTSTSWLESLKKQPVPSHTGIYKLHLQTQATIGSAAVRDSVKLPPGIDIDEWIASQLVGIYEEVVQIISVLEAVCSEESCPRMSAGKHTHYSWADAVTPFPQPLSAPDYTRRLAMFAELRLSDRSLLPVDGSRFPPQFREIASTLCKRFFRVYAHAYLSHFQVIRDHGAEGHLNCCYKHFLFFVMEFCLVAKEDMQPLWDLSERFLEQDRSIRFHRYVRLALFCGRILRPQVLRARPKSG